MPSVQTTLLPLLLLLLNIPSVTPLKGTSLSFRTGLKSTDFSIPKSRVKRSYIGTTFRTEIESLYGFFVDVNIGTPSQLLTLELKSSPNSWVPAPNTSVEVFCDQVENARACDYGEDSGYFRPGESSTFENQTGVLNNNYGAGFFAVGTYGSDTFRINQVTVPDLHFGLASNWSIEPVLGIGIREPSERWPYPPLPVVMASNDQINLVSYSIYANSRTSSGGEIYFGAIDEDKFDGPLKVFNSKKVGTVPITGVWWYGPGGKNESLMGNSVSFYKREGEIQIGVPSLWVPNEIYNEILSKVFFRARYSTDYELYIQPCRYNEDLGSIAIAIDGVIVEIPGTEFLTEYPANSGSCIIDLISMDEDPNAAYSFALGTPFLRGAYAVFDHTNNQTSLAPAKLNSTSARLVELPKEGVVPINTKTATNSSPSSTSTDTTPSPTDTPTPTPTPSPKPEEKKSTPVAPIVGGVVGGLAAVAIVGLLVWFFGSRRRRNDTPEVSEAPIPPTADDPRASVYKPVMPIPGVVPLGAHNDTRTHSMISQQTHEGRTFSFGSQPSQNQFQYQNTGSYGGTEIENGRNGAVSPNYDLGGAPPYNPTSNIGFEASPYSAQQGPYAPYRDRTSIPSSSPHGAENGPIEVSGYNNAMNAPELSDPYAANTGVTYSPYRPEYGQPGGNNVYR